MRYMTRTCKVVPIIATASTAKVFSKESLPDACEMQSCLPEIGEPARKAMIVDFAQDNVRARSVGLICFVRSLSITPAAAIGGLLWSFYAAATIHCGGSYRSDRYVRLRRNC